MASQVVYVDTEGFESAGRSNAYDDRIFALSTLLSSVLIYNLPGAPSWRLVVAAGQCRRAQLAHCPYGSAR